MERKSLKRFTKVVVITSLVILLYRVFFLRKDKTSLKSSLKDTEKHSEWNFNVSIGDKVDEFMATLRNHSQKSGHRVTATYAVSDRYSEFGVKDSLSCWDDSKFKETFMENSNFVYNYAFGTSRPYLKELGLETDIDYLDKENPKIPVFVTAASSNHFLEMQGLIQNLHNAVFPKYKNLIFIFYDIGLNVTEQKMVKKHCRCEYRSFPFEKYPNHVKDISGYTWKPLIAQSLLNEFGFIMWVDASIRFRSGELDSLFEMGIKHGIKIGQGSLGVGHRTDPITFKFLGEDPCLYADKNEMETGLFIIYRTRFTVQTIMRPWLSCALTLGCMYFQGSQARILCKESKELGTCHRFEQSVLGIILWRLYHGDINRVVIPRRNEVFDVQRGHISRYFDSLEEEKKK